MVRQVEREVGIPAQGAWLPGTLVVPAGASGVVLFAHGSGSSRLSPRNREVAAVLQRGGIGTLLFDLLTEPESLDRRHVFDIERLAARLDDARAWLVQQPGMEEVAVGYFGASTGAAAALVAVADHPGTVRAVVSRGGRPDLAGEALGRVTAPTLLIVGGADTGVVELNEAAFQRLRGEKRIAIVPGATHLFDEPGTLEEVARLARSWFATHLAGARAATTP
jgi:putative phosphoribosyl transferase